MAKLSPRERLFNLRKIDRNGCWNWTGGLDADGYGRICIKNQRWLVHRLAYVLLIGLIPKGMHLHHRCENPRCFNPRHLAVLTPADHALQHDTPPTRNKAKTCCDNGHEFSDGNTYTHGGRRRQCRTCNSKAVRRYKLRQKSQAMEGSAHA